MRAAAFVTALFLVAPSIPCANATVSPVIDPQASLGVVQQWIYNYRAKPDYVHVPAAVRVLFHAQTFKEPENAGIYLGFIAGAIGGRMGHRARRRLFRTAGLAESVAQDRAADAGTPGDDQ
jgi:hypothetical protein